MTISLESLKAFVQHVERIKNRVVPKETIIKYKCSYSSIKNMILKLHYDRTIPDETLTKTINLHLEYKRDFFPPLWLSS